MKINREYVLNFARGLGFDPNRVSNIRITHDTVEVTEIALSAEGKAFLEGGEVAKTHYSVEIIDP